MNLSATQLLHINALGDGHIGGVPGAYTASVAGSLLTTSDPYLHNINIGSASASAVLKIYQGPYPGNTPSTTGSLVMIIDCSNTNARAFDFGKTRIPYGMYWNMSGAAASVTVVYE